MAKKPKEYCTASLYVSGRGLDPDLVTQLFRVEPDRAIADGKMTVKKGSRKIVRPFKRSSDVGSWVCKIEKSRRRKESVEQQIYYWCKFLRRRKKAVQRLRKPGAEISLDAFMMETTPLFIDLPAFLSDLLSELKVPVRMTIYDINDPTLFPSKKSKS